MKNNKLYFIFIFDTKDKENDNIENFIPKEININENNLFYPELNEVYSEKLFNYLIKGKNIDIVYKDFLELLKKKQNINQKKLNY